jgi:hypothetical protein
MSIFFIVAQMVLALMTTNLFLITGNFSSLHAISPISLYVPSTLFTFTGAVPVSNMTDWLYTL